MASNQLPPADWFCTHGYALDDAPHPAAGLEACPNGCNERFVRNPQNDARCVIKLDKNDKAKQERLLNLWVTMPNYTRIVYGFVPPWNRDKP